LAVTHKLFGPFMKHIASGAITDITSTAVYVSLMTTDWTFDQDSEYWSTISTGQISTGTHYTPGGDLLNEKSLAYAARITTLSATSETTFTSTGSITAGFAVTRATCHLISCVDFGDTEEAVSGAFKITWTDGKILTMTVSA